MYKIAVFVSGRGSNLRAIINSQKSELKNIEIVDVVCNNLDCAAVELAKENNISVCFVKNSKDFGYITYEELAERLIHKEVDLIVLAGFIKKIPDDFIDAFENKIINIHPALLPAFGGKGMYGINVHKAVFESTTKISGPTVHFVDKIYDNGKIIAQKVVDISNVNTPEEIAERVLAEEHKLLPNVLKKFSENKITKVNNRIFILD